MKASFHVLDIFSTGNYLFVRPQIQNFSYHLIFHGHFCIFSRVRSFMSPQRKYDFQSKTANVSNSSTYGYFHGNSQKLFFTESFFVFTRLTFFSRVRKNAGFNCSDLGKSVTSAQVCVLRFAQILISAQIWVLRSTNISKSDQI